MRDACNDQTCHGFLEKFAELSNNGKFQAYLQDQYGLTNTERLLQEAIQGIHAVRFDGIDRNCIDAAVRDIVSRLSKHWPSEHAS